MSKVAVIKLRNSLKRELQIINTMDVLKQIAVSEFQFLEKSKHEATQFLKTVESFFYFYKAWKLKEKHFFRNQSKIEAVIAVSSDEGFQGSLNHQILEKAADYARGNPNVRVVVLGKRGAAKVRDSGVEAHELPGIPFPLSYEAILPLKRYLMDLYMKDQIGSAKIIYAKCHSFTRQTLEESRLLPFNIDHLEKIKEHKSQEDTASYVIIEPTMRKIVEYTIALWFGRKLYEIFWDSKLSEVANRAIELNERYEHLMDTHAKTRARFFRANHEVIDAGIREVFASHHFFAASKKTNFSEELEV